ncbi:hypothetical protein [Phycisphaera mikurensis]|uniref:Glycoside hydrolase n=1 Tax=Phycisphaera mikurensis (strain NBRC 102666 / KCTC 22515 / FYK2301M01) TaxID=1142394 RepID=I0ICP5_PHYMF|nr:hypothetical protein [Phycisphaera mikurensis]MBB6442094.1 hypothetical protein [Phycisphaera mikurensis]BAM03033.1 hypothetical protein PSMK_08740 [Phycisphaera mikurensis NBRC 102666]
MNRAEVCPRGSQPRLENRGCARFLLATLLLLACASNAKQPEQPELAPRDIRFLEYGWNLPPLAMLVDHPQRFAARPFDGVVFKPVAGDRHRGASGTPLLFDARPWDAAAVGLEAARRIGAAGGATGHHLLALQASTQDRGPVDPVGWFDDRRWGTITANLRLYASAAVEAGFGGFFLNEEAYGSDPWAYTREAFPGRSLAQVRAKVRARGAQAIAALQEGMGTAEFELVTMFGLCATHLDSDETDLVASFYDGWLDAIGPSTRIVDGNENGFYHALPATLDRFRRAQREAQARLAPENRETYIRHRGTGHGFYTDLVVAPELYEDFFFTRRLASFIDPEDRPAFAVAHLFNHARMAEDLVWFLTEDYDWWRPEGERTTRAKLTPPAWFESAIREVRQHVRAGTRPDPTPEVLEEAVRRQAAFVAAAEAAEAAGPGSD